MTQSVPRPGVFIDNWEQLGQNDVVADPVRR